MTHTPTPKFPWIIKKVNERYCICQQDEKVKGRVWQLASFVTKEDAEHIVKCVNERDKLVQERDSFNKEAYEFRVLYNELFPKYDKLVKALEEIIKVERLCFDPSEGYTEVYSIAKEALEAVK